MVPPVASFAAAPYSLLPTSPSSAEDVSTAYLEKQHELRRSRHPSAAHLAWQIKSPLTPPWRRTALFVAGLAALGIVALLATHSTVHHLVWPAGELQYTARHKIAYDFETTEFNNVWRPYEEECQPSELMQGVIKSIEADKKKPTGFRQHRQGPLRSHDTTLPAALREIDDDGSPFFPWLVNATILLLGDSMERLHLSDFCDLVGGELTNIHPNHSASPPVYRKPLPTVLGLDGKETDESVRAKEERRKLEDEWEARERSWFFTRPWVCDIKEYNATLISTLHWGMEDMEEAYQSEDFYHGPPTWLQRFHHITLPLISNLAIHLNRPQILFPSMIEICAGYWELRAMTEEDFIKAGIPRPYPKDSDLAFREIGKTREERWVRHATELMKDVAKAFPGEKGVRDGPVLSWRTLHHPKRNNYTPYSRVAALDQLSRKTMHELRISSLATHPTFLSSIMKRVHDTADRYFPIETLDELKAGHEDDVVDYGFDERIRIDEIGRLLEGQEDHYRDFLHPSVLPGSYVWGDIMLYELKRAHYRIGRSD
ncbi:hypothetical protein JCM5296_005858 [Sporobolomyces johnsonii]